MPPLIPPRAFLSRCRRNLRRGKIADSTGDELTGGSLLMRTLILRRILLREVIKPDERFVGLLLPPSNGGVLANAAVQLMGRVPVNLNFTAGREAMTAVFSELARILMPKKTWAEGLDQLGKMVQMRLQSHPGSQSSLEYPKDLPAKVKSELEGALPYEELVALHARELSGAYTDAELAELLAFYKSPIGQKSLAKMGEVQNKVGQETQARIEAKMPDIMKRLSSTAKVTPAKEGAKGAAPAGGQKPAGHP
jgi:hypothetical protein